jgi:hypothetical protein
LSTELEYGLLANDKLKEALDDTIIGASQLHEMPEAVKLFGKLTKGAADVDEIIGFAAFLKEGQMIVEQTEQDEIMIACVNAGRDRATTDTIVQQCCPGYTWGTLTTREQVITSHLINA